MEGGNTATNWSAGVRPGSGSYVCLPTGSRVSVPFGYGPATAAAIEGAGTLIVSDTLSLADATVSSTIEGLVVTATALPNGRPRYLPAPPG